MKFADIPGHDDVKEKLRTLVDNDIFPHALLLQGPSGTGKFALTRALAQYIHCQNRQNGDSCGVCPACIRHQAFSDIDTHFVFPVVKRENDKIPPVSDDFLEEWKEFLDGRIHMDFEAWARMLDKKNKQPVTYVTESENLIHKLSFASHSSRYRIVLWWLPEKMNIEAANKLLKIIEEPFEDTIFILASDNPQLIIETIYSRLQRINIKALSSETIATVLQDRYAVDQENAKEIARKSHGNMTAAINALDSQSDDYENLDFFIRLMRLAYQRKISDLREWANELAARGREREIKFYEYASKLIRENFIFNFNIPSINYLNQKESDFSKNFARFINEKNVEKIIETFNNARIDIQGNGNGKIINLDVAIRVILLLKQ